MKQTGAVLIHKNKNKMKGGRDYISFRSIVPKDLALNFLGLKIDGEKQRLTWRVEEGRVFVENEKRR